MEFVMHYLLNEIFTTGDIPEDSAAANLRSQTDFYNYHNPKYGILFQINLKTLLLSLHFKIK